jgi:hypothetical protein
MSDPFITNTMALTSESGTPIASGLLCQLDNVNLSWNAEQQGLEPTDWWDLYSVGWSSPIPARGDYFVVTVASPTDSVGTKYQMFSTLYAGPDTLQLRVVRYSGVTP